MIFVENTTPYRWPFDGTIDPHLTALVVTGCDAASTGANPPDAAAEDHLVLLRSSLAAVGVLVVLVMHQSPGRPLLSVAPHARAITPLPGELIVAAAGLDGFYGSSLDALLHRRGRSHLVLAGIGFETTVHSTLRRANDRGYECLVAGDASVCVDPDLRPAAVSTIEMSGGIFGAVGTTADVLAAFNASTDTTPHGRIAPESLTDLEQ